MNLPLLLKHKNDYSKYISVIQHFQTIFGLGPAIPLTSSGVFALLRDLHHSYDWCIVKYDNNGLDHFRLLSRNFRPLSSP